MPARTITQRRKDELVKRAREHKEADHLIQGTYGETSSDGIRYYEGLKPKRFDRFAGCAIGCLSNPVGLRSPIKDAGAQYAVLEQEFGVPEALLSLVDSIFEQLPPRKARNWPLQFAEALPVGVRLTNEDVLVGLDKIIGSSDSYRPWLREEYEDNADAARRAVRRWLVSLS